MELSHPSPGHRAGLRLWQYCLTIGSVVEDYFFSFAKLHYVSGPRPPGCILCALRDQDEGVQRLPVGVSAYHMICHNLYPFNPGHLLIFPLRHVLDLRLLKPEEHRDFYTCLQASLDALDTAYRPQGYNIGWNMGLPAGASIPHLHAHVIPRYSGEIGIAELLGGKRVLVEDPRDSARRLAELMPAGLKLQDPESF